MSGNDQLSESAALRDLRDSLSGVPMPAPPPLAAIEARGRELRRRRRSTVMTLSVAGLAASAALAVGLTGVLGRAPAGGALQTLAPGTIRTASYTLVRHGDGTDTLSIEPQELLDSAALQRDLTRSGIPAKVTTGSFCSSDPAPAGYSDVVSEPPGPTTFNAGTGGHPTITFDAAAMPAGAELSFGTFRLPSGEQQANMALIDASSYTCTSTAPALGPGTSGFGLVYGGPGAP